MSYLKYTFFLAIIGLIAACSSNQKEAKTEKEMPKEQVTTPTPNTNYSTHNVPWSEISSFDKVDFDYLVPYGEAELQIGELRTPLSQDTFPLVIFIHGGCWMSAYNLDHVSTVCADLVKEGYAVWTSEYRRVGNEGGGYPNTFKDIQDNYKISRIDNLINSVVVTVNEINATFTIDKKELPANLGFDMKLKIEATHIPDGAKIKYFFINWN